MSEPDNPYQGPATPSFQQEEGSRDWRALARIACAASCILAGFLASVGVVAGIVSVIQLGIDPGRILGDARSRTMLLAQCGLAVAAVLFFDAARSWLSRRSRRAAVESVLALGLSYAFVWVLVSR
jgi:hypothetical protein